MLLPAQCASMVMLMSPWPCSCCHGRAHASKAIGHHAMSIKRKWSQQKVIIWFCLVFTSWVRAIYAKSESDDILCIITLRVTHILMFAHISIAIATANIAIHVNISINVNICLHAWCDSDVNLIVMPASSSWQQLDETHEVICHDCQYSNTCKYKHTCQYLFTCMM